MSHNILTRDSGDYKVSFYERKKMFSYEFWETVSLKLPQGHEDSEYVLSFEIGQREGGFYSGRTDTPSTVF